MKKYMPRIADEVLTRRLEARGAVLIQGPKWCGKSTTAEQLAQSTIYMQDPSTREQNMMLAKADASRFLSGKLLNLLMNGRLYLLFGMQSVLRWISAVSLVNSFLPGQLPLQAQRK